MALDREYQRKMLELLATTYPQKYDIRQMAKGWSQEEDQRYASNMLYLEEHGLVESEVKIALNGNVLTGLPRITAKGMDYLSEDGGLTAELGAVTIKFHEDTLKQLIGKRIEESDLPKQEKSKLLEQLSSLPGEVIKKLTLKLVDTGLANWPAALGAIELFAKGHGL